MKSPLPAIGSLIIVMGLVVIILSMYLAPGGTGGEVEEATENSTVAWGGCIIILFIPICFGGGNPALYPWLIILSIILSIIIIIAMIATIRRLVPGAS